MQCIFFDLNCLLRLKVSNTDFFYGMKVVYSKDEKRFCCVFFSGDDSLVLLLSPLHFSLRGIVCNNK